MPWVVREEWVAPELYLSYAGVDIYYAYEWYDVSPSRPVHEVRNPKPRFGAFAIIPGVLCSLNEDYYRQVFSLDPDDEDFLFPKIRSSPTLSSWFIALFLQRENACTAFLKHLIDMEVLVKDDVNLPRLEAYSFTLADIIKGCIRCKVNGCHISLDKLYDLIVGCKSFDDFSTLAGVVFTDEGLAALSI